MKEMMNNLWKYVRKKKLESNVEKTKMMVFNMRKRKSEENEWNWEETGLPVKKRKDWEQKKMDECRAEWMRQSHRQARKKGKNQRIPIQQGVPGERMCYEKREKQWTTCGMDVAKWERRERKGDGR
jgi:hypothetical protein